MTIFFIGKFERFHDEEYIARSFEILGHTVIRCEESVPTNAIIEQIERAKPNFVLWVKLNISDPMKLVTYCRSKLVKTVCWVFDLYWGYAREHQIHSRAMFKADLVVTTDGGHGADWARVFIIHKCIRQGIYKDHCVLEKGQAQDSVVFLGSQNDLYPYRQKMLDVVGQNFNLVWLGKHDTNEVRGMDLNKVFAEHKIVVGDSVFSPHYWSNRVVETLGRGGFLIHQDVPGIKEAYPHLVTYRTGDLDDLIEKIRYYLTHESERKEIVKKNFEWVKKHYTMDKMCNELIQWVNQ